MKTSVITTANEKDTILAALSKFVESGPGLDFGNYGNISEYRAEQRQITRDLRDARALLSHWMMRSHVVSANDLKQAFESAFSGRLSWDGASLDYTTGQYYPTEYRKAVCAVIARALTIAYDPEDYRRFAISNFPKSLSRWF